MSRGSVPGLPTAAPLGELLPSYLQEDEFAMRWTAGLDDVLAPVFSVLDCLDSYVDPRLTPEDFLVWLGGWVGAYLDERWELSRARDAVRSAVDIHRLRGTAAGLRAQFEVATGGTVEIVESGGVSWSSEPGQVPVPPDFHVHIRITVTDPEHQHRAALEDLAEAAKPAHLTHTIEVIGDDRLS